MQMMQVEKGKEQEEQEDQEQKEVHDSAINQFLKLENISFKNFLSTLDLHNIETEGRLLKQQQTVVENHLQQLTLNFRNNERFHEDVEIISEYRMELDKNRIHYSTTSHCEETLHFEDFEDVESFSLPQGQSSNDIAEYSDTPVKIDNFVDSEDIQSDYVPSGIHFASAPDESSIQHSQTNTDQKSPLISNHDYDSASDECEELEGGVYSNSIDILNDKGELCHVNGFSLELPLANMGITATYANEIGIKSDADIFITHYIKNYISNTQSIKGDTFEEFLLDENLNIIDEEEKEDDIQSIHDDHQEYIPMRLKKLMQEYESGDINLSNIKLDDMARNFDDIETFE